MSDNISIDDNERTTESQINSAVENSFFYTNDRFFQKLDMYEVLQYVFKFYPTFSLSHSDVEIKKTLLEMLKNEEFMTDTLKLYNLTIQEFFKILYAHYGALFKGVYLKKIQREVEKYQ